MVIGITGGVGCGKSTVIKIMEEKYHAKILVADDIGHELMQKGQCVCREIRDCFGEEIFMENGEIDRKYLAEIVYKDKNSLDKLNAIVHPHVLEEIKSRLSEWEKEPLVVLETALLFETGCDAFCDRIVGIHTDREIRIKRLMESRNYTKEKAESIMANQLPDEEIERYCDIVIVNNEEIEQLERQIGAICMN